MDLLTQQEAATLLGVSVQTIRRFRLSGRLKTVRLSYRSVRIPKLDVERLIEGSKCNTTGNRQGLNSNQTVNGISFMQKEEEAKDFHFEQMILLRRKLVTDDGKKLTISKP